MKTLPINPPNTNPVPWHEMAEEIARDYPFTVKSVLDTHQAAKITHKGVEYTILSRAKCRCRPNYYMPCKACKSHILAQHRDFGNGSPKAIAKLILVYGPAFVY